MKILGLNPGPHDAAAALVVDGQVRAFLEEERLNRKKRSPGLVPLRAAATCLSASNIDLSQIDAVAVGWDVCVTTAGTDTPSGDEGLRAWLLPREIFGDAAVTVPIVCVAHHLAHAASAYLTSPWDDAVVLVVDGRGEAESTSIFHGHGGALSLMASYDVASSLGNFYSRAAWWAGLDEHDAGKLMGLAPYGRPRFRLPLRVTDAHLFDFGPDAPSDPFEMQLFQQEKLFACFQELYPFRRGDAREIMAYADFAASVQAVLEEAVLGLCAKWTARLGCGRVAFSGGVASNCTLNGRLMAAPCVDELRVSPVPYDAGVALGAALWVSQQKTSGPLRRALLDHPYWQPPAPSDPEQVRLARSLLARAGCAVVAPPDDGALAAYVARRLAAGAVVGLCQGDGEIGQRALGGRSFLCDPRDRRALVRMNELKGREMWRPVAPSVQAEHWRSLFGTAPQTPARFMLAAYPVRPEAQRTIPACVHVDGSARPQIVYESASPLYWRIIDAFRQLTGVPAVLNTSFNLADEPIVYSMEDAIRTFLRCSADTLVLGAFVLEKGGPCSGSG